MQDSGESDHTFGGPSAPAGVLADSDLRRAVGEGWVRSEDAIPEASYQPASLDLRLGPTAHRLRSSFLPSEKRVKERLADYSMGSVDLRRGGILEKNRPYLVPLLEEVRLPPSIWAKANPRSSIGRLDVFTRVITDYGQRFDEIQTGYAGPLFLEVVSRSFTIRVREGLSLNQLRLIRGSAKLGDADIRALHTAEPLLFKPSAPGGAPTPLSQDYLDSVVRSSGLFLSVDLRPPTGRVGYRAKKNSMLVDLSKTQAHVIGDYWEEVRAEQNGRLILEPEEFYLLVSEERVSIPPGVAAEMTAYDPTSGELRTHYAGFFDPGFGYNEAGTLAGSKAVMEVRAHDVPFALEHGQKIAKLEFERMAGRPEQLYGSGSVGSYYQDQTWAISRHFIPPPLVSPQQAGLPGFAEPPPH